MDKYNMDNRIRQAENFDEVKKTAKAKKNNVALSASYKRLGWDKKAARVGECFNRPVYAYIFAEKRLKFQYSKVCRDRLCAVCSRIKSREIFGEVSGVMDYVLAERKDLTPIFLTITLKTCLFEDLCDVLDAVFKGWNRLVSNDRIKRIVAGWFRGLEVTYDDNRRITPQMYARKQEYFDKRGLKVGDDNPNYDHYHPHIHAIMLVPPTYFTNPKNYMTTEKWVKTWRKSMRLDYDPVCYVEKVTSDENGSVGGGVAEVAKYTVKSADYIKSSKAETDKLVKNFSIALKGRRLYAFGGVMKEAAKILSAKKKSEKTDSREVKDANGNVLRKDIDYVLVALLWNLGISRYEYDGIVGVNKVD